MLSSPFYSLTPEEKLEYFENAIGTKVRCIGSPLVDVVTGVDRQYDMLVCTERYGNWHVTLIEPYDSNPADPRSD